jgi:hypothetical protein
VRKSHGKCPVRRPERRWEANSKINLREIVVRIRGGWYWFKIVTNLSAFILLVLNLRVPLPQNWFEGKVVPALLTDNRAMKEYWGSEGIVPLIL